MIQVNYCYSRDLDTNTLVDMVENLPFPGLEISTNRFGRLGIQYKPKKHMEKMRSMNISNLSLEGKNDSFHLQRIGNYDMCTVFWQFVDSGLDAIDDLVKYINKGEAFTSGYAFHDNDFFWQNESSVLNYEQAGRPHQHLPKVWDDAFEVYDIDIKQNPGYRFGLPGMWMQSCWRMWFGLPAQMYLDRERLLSFPDAHRIEEFPSGVIFIELHEDPNDFEKYRDRQAHFRKWSGMDALAERADDINNAAADPIYEMETGVFPHGGVRLVTTWLDKNGKPIKKSSASSRVIHEWDEQGKTIYKEEIKV